jgi:PucR family transcriptional regulator, purine catabolism regulatory protein
VPICLSDLLSDPVVRRGDPIVLSGADLLGRPIRWLHSSDIYEIAPLLRDGDVLLTTGLAETIAAKYQVSQHMARFRLNTSGVLLQARRATPR